MTEKKDWLKVLGGVVAVAGAIALFPIIRSSWVSCELGAVGVEAIVTGISHGETARQIAEFSEVVPEVCETLIDTLIENPQEPVSFELHLPDGSSLDRTVPGTTILGQPTQPPASSVDIQRLIDCLGWHSDLLYDLCVDGKLAPPMR